MPLFTAPGLYLDSATLVAPDKVRVRFSLDPLLANPSGTYDALNVDNWSFAGPGIVSASLCEVVIGDPKAIDLTLSMDLPTGSWEVVAGDIRTVVGDEMEDPTSINIEIGEFPAALAVSA